MGLPMAAIAGWAAIWADGLRAWQNLLEHQVAILKHQESVLRSRNVIAHGSSWHDHYGRRVRDVDVERV